jgi:hypothetical protein
MTPCTTCALLLCEQVLSILDGSASSWPGLSSALSDLDSLVILTVKHAGQLDHAKTKLEAEKAQLATSLSGKKLTKHLQWPQHSLATPGEHPRSAALPSFQCC